MGTDKQYLSVEPIEGTDRDELLNRLLVGDLYDAREAEHDGCLIVAGNGGDFEAPWEKLAAVGDAIVRAFSLTVIDTTATGIGTLYRCESGELVEVESLEGRDRYGIDVVDYFKREYDIQGPR
ncbi:hypothetical protein [Natrinema gari]|uniref:Uncharacterized protein n=1 Tax=Natrinema gari JCM 14663 TaxID=1230459 RepID=L9Z775_9EURY|nr:hypothetical protein [Natrinema gari]ELY81023.1 hypothetical protein C486_07993 [Natrinema gari JCM 14663]